MKDKILTFPATNVALAGLTLLPFSAHASDKKVKLVLTSEAGDRESPIGQSMQTQATVN